MDYYATSLEHLLAELERIDLLVQAQVWRARQVQPADEFSGLYVSEQRVDLLMAQPAGLPAWAAAAPFPAEIQAKLEHLTAVIAERKAASAQQGITLRLDELARHFQLTLFDVDALLIGLAPELDLRYARLYAYLQDDVTRKRPSVDLVLNLLCSSFETKLAARQRFAPGAPLRKDYLLHLFDDAAEPQPVLLSKSIKVDERVVSYLLNADEIDTRLLPYAQCKSPHARLNDLLLPSDVKQRLLLLVQQQTKDEHAQIFYFHGPYGVGKQTTAEAICQELNLKLLVIDGERLAQDKEANFAALVQLIQREARLQGAAIYWEGFTALLIDDQHTRQEVLLHALEAWPGLTFLAGDTVWEPVDALREASFVRIEFSRPTQPQRVQLWALSLNGSTPREADLAMLAGKFRLSAGQIRDAATTARNLARWRDPETSFVTMYDLHAACRLQSNRRLATLARKIVPHYTWDDIILPADRLQQLREICLQVKHGSLVYDSWGFDRKLAMGKGINILFAGPSGTGKTMAADIIAGELDLDLYKIDLATVVSKYIGETEKNLARIFAEAETSNAILFFDEADALFGKRSEVKDAHDRYANIEISYLLQKMEEYEGIVILATNFKRNMDDAFVRRLHFSIEFPFPSEQDRRRIWTHIWPEHTPCSPPLDLDFLARRFEVTGGNIRNIALTAAFLAAEDGGNVNMIHLIRATQREYQKMGKVVLAGEFGEYAGQMASQEGSVIQP